MSADASPGAAAPYRLVALDVDGTVLNDSQVVTPALKAVLGALPRLGVRTVLCTGRRWRTTHPVIEEMEHAHPVAVCCGGGLVKRADDERTLYSDPMPELLAREAVRRFREGGLVPLLLYDRPLSGRELMVSEADRRRARDLPYLQVNRDYVRWYEGEYPELDEAPLIAYTMDEGRRVKAVEEEVLEEIGSRGLVEGMDQERYGATQRALEVHGPATTKWHALRWLLEAAGLGFAMGNALPRVKAAADEVTASNEEDGVARALRRVFPALGEEATDVR